LVRRFRTGELVVGLGVFFLEDEAGELYGGGIVEDEVGGSGKRGGKEARFD
jgi:hypothetical protein